jgi:hypothetical protein
MIALGHRVIGWAREAARDAAELRRHRRPTRPPSGAGPLGSSEPAGAPARRPCGPSGSLKPSGGRLAAAAYPVTPDGRYFVVRGRLWRCSDPSLDEGTRQALVGELMACAPACSGRQAQCRRSQSCAGPCRCRQAEPRRAWTTVVDGRRARLQPAHGPEHALRRLVCDLAWPVTAPAPYNLAE